jgi:hypothetical protein
LAVRDTARVQGAHKLAKPGRPRLQGRNGGGERCDRNGGDGKRIRPCGRQMASASGPADAVLANRKEQPEPSLHAVARLASVYLHYSECAVATGCVAGSLVAWRARSLSGRGRLLLISAAASLGSSYALKNAICYGIAQLFETTIDPAVSAGWLKELESKMAGKRFNMKPRKEKRASSVWLPFSREKAEEAPTVTLSLSSDNLHRLFDELDVDNSGTLDEKEVRRLIERYFAATVSTFRESTPGLFQKAGLASYNEEELLPEPVIVSFIQAFAETQVTQQARQ